MVGGLSFRRREEGYLNKEENRKGSRRRNEANAKRSGAVDCSAVVVMIKKKGGGLLWLRTIIQYRQAGSNRLGWLDDGNNKCRCSGKAA